MMGPSKIRHISDTQTFRSASEPKSVIYVLTVYYQSKAANSISPSNKRGGLAA